MEAKSIAERQKSGSAWIWLCYLIFFLIEPAFEPRLHLWLKTVAVLALFLPVYSVYVRTRSETTRRWMIAATFALGLASMPWNSGGITFLIYTAAFLPFSVRRVSVVLALFTVESAACLAEVYWLHVPLGNAMMGVLLLCAIGGGNIFQAQEHRAGCKLRMAQEEIEALAALAERERIARDLHDVLGHTLSVITLKAELAGRLLQQGAGAEQAAVEIADVERMARTSLAEVREAIGGYRARGFAAELEHARRTLEAAGVRLRVEEIEPHGVLSAPEETALSLALREAVTNIVRHAGATTCRLRFVALNGHRRLAIEDDGRHLAEVEGNGLRGMRERVEALGGRVALERGSGTRLLIDLPLRVVEPAAGVAR